VIDLKLFRQDPEAFRRALLRRQDPALPETLDRLADLERRWRAALGESERLKAERNAANEEVAQRKRAKAPADDLLAKLKESGERGKQLDAQVKAIEQ